MFSRSQRQTPDSIYDDFRTIRKSALRTAIFVTLLVSGIVPAISLFWHGDSALPLSHSSHHMGVVLLHTYPLTVAVALITLARQQQWLHWGHWTLAATMVAICATLGNFLGEFTGHGRIPPVNLLGTSHPVFGVPASGINYLSGFYAAYGVRTFVAAILAGTFAGKAASRILKYVPRDADQAARLADKLFEAQRVA